MTAAPLAGSLPQYLLGAARVQGRTRRGGAVAVLLAFAAGGCGSDTPVAPASVPGAIPYTALAAYPFWWSLVQACSGLRGDLAAVRWARVPGDALPGYADGRAGQWDPATNTITVGAKDTAIGPLIRHEMLHALLGAAYAPGHPAAYFGARCGGTVLCDGFCATEVAAGTNAPAGAPALPTDDLTVAARIVAPAAGTGTAGGAFAIVVSVQNALGTAGWVSRAAGPNGPGTATFGYRLTTPSLPTFPYSGFSPDTAARVYLAAGDTKQYVFDANTAEFFLSGTYTLQGSFAGAMSAPTAVTLPP